MNPLPHPYRLPAAALAAVLALGLAGCEPNPTGTPPDAPPRPSGNVTNTPVPTSSATVDRRDAGRRIAAETFTLLSSNLLAAIARDGITNALEFCSVNVAPITTAVAVPNGVTLARVTHRPRNPANRVSTAEHEILESFRAGFAAGRTNPPVLVNDTGGAVTFYSPIVLGNPLCLQCHGAPGADIAPSTLAAIDRLYPADEARGFALNELRGLWRIRFPPP